MTIRRDLIDLENQSLLVRVHGGAHRKIKDSLMEASHLEKNMLNVEEKKEEIASKCAALTAEGDTIFIGAGTTTDFYWRLPRGEKHQYCDQFFLHFREIKGSPKL